MEYMRAYIVVAGGVSEKLTKGPWSRLTRIPSAPLQAFCKQKSVLRAQKHPSFATPQTSPAFLP